MIQFTSGSTGNPKGCSLSQRSLRENAGACTAKFSLHAGDFVYNWMPYHHDMGLMAGVIAPVIARMISIVESPRSFILDPAGWLVRLGKFPNAHATAPNFALSLALRALKRGRAWKIDLSGVRSLICGAEPIDADLVRSFMAATAEFGMRPEAFVACYGMAEVTVLASANTCGLRTIFADKHALEAEGIFRPRTGANTYRELVSLGPPATGTEIQIVEESATLSDGNVGEIWLRSASVMAGYYADQDASEAVLADGWLKTGDNGLILDGNLYFVGRRKDILIVSGQNFDPHDIERRVASMVNVDARRLCAVTVPVADRRMGLAIVVEGQKVRKGGDLEANIVRSCFEITGIRPLVIGLSGQKIPRTSSGKPRRAYFAELYEISGEAS